LIGKKGPLLGIGWRIRRRGGRGNFLGKRISDALGEGKKRDVGSASSFIEIKKRKEVERRKEEKNLFRPRPGAETAKPGASGRPSAGKKGKSSPMPRSRPRGEKREKSPPAFRLSTGGRQSSK